MLGRSDHRFGYLTSGPINLTRLAKKLLERLNCSNKNLKINYIGVK